MKKMDLKEMKECLLRIMEYIDKICRENNIRYTIVGGTLIGAIRHKGFIPWDDDIDIALERNEYEKLIKIFNFQSNGKYKILDYRNTKKYYYPFAKIVDTETYLDEERYLNCKELGVYIDIFPIDKISKKNIKFKILRLKILNKLFCLSVCNNEYYKNKPLGKKIIRKLSLIHNYEWYIKKLDKYAQIENEKECEYKGIMVVGQGKKDIYPKDIFDEYEDYIFEDIKLMGIKNYNKLLEHRFGNYMKLPPENERRSEHLMNAYFLKKE